MEKKVIAILALALGLSPAHSKTLRFVCNYTATPKGLGAEPFKLEFAYDDVADKGFLIGNNGIADVIAHHGSSGITFSEQLGTGAVQTTSVTSSGESVHSRHSMMGSSLIPSQYYGKCTIKSGG